MGATGMLGHMVCRVLGSTFEAHGICRDIQGVPEAQRTCFEACTLHSGLEALEVDSIRTHLDRVQPDVVINCIGAVKQLADGQEALPAIRINAMLPHVLAEECDARGAKLIQVSTDCVFSGKKGSYTEEDLPDPEDVYGRSKLLGEVSREPHLTIRTSIIGPQLRGETGLFEWFRAQGGGEVRGFGRAIFSGLTTDALAQVLRHILSDYPELTGLFHVSSEPISKFDLLGLINRRFQLGFTIQRDDSLVCDRSLDSSRFRGVTGIQIPDQQSMVENIPFGVRGR